VTPVVDDLNGETQADEVAEGGHAVETLEGVDVGLGADQVGGADMGFGDDGKWVVRLELNGASAGLADQRYRGSSSGSRRISSP